MLAGQSIETLREIMGHSTVQVTERYAHLRPELFGAAHRAAIKVSLAPGTVADATDHHVATGADDVAAASG